MLQGEIILDSSTVYVGGALKISTKFTSRAHTPLLASISLERRVTGESELLGEHDAPIKTMLHEEIPVRSGQTDYEYDTRFVVPLNCQPSTICPGKFKVLHNVVLRVQTSGTLFFSFFFSANFCICAKLNFIL
jgi:hypothetical protein